MKTTTIFAILFNFATAFIAYCETTPEEELLNTTRNVYISSINKYLNNKKIEPKSILTEEQVVKSTIEQLLEKLNVDINAREYDGPHESIRKSYNSMLNYKKQVAAKRIQTIEDAIKSNNNKLLSEQAKQSLEEDLRGSLMRLISCVTMLIEDDPFGKDPVKKKDETLDKLTEEYWSIKNKLAILVKPEVPATVPK
jgi:hypothetical protein